MKKIDTRFAERIRAKRKAKALRQYQLANLVGIDPVYISQIETGRKVPTVPIAKRLAIELEDNVEEYIRWAALHRAQGDARKYFEPPSPRYPNLRGLILSKCKNRKETEQQLGTQEFGFQERLIVHTLVIRSLETVFIDTELKKSSNNELTQLKEELLTSDMEPEASAEFLQKYGDITGSSEDTHALIEEKLKREYNLPGRHLLTMLFTTAIDSWEFDHSRMELSVNSSIPVFESTYAYLDKSAEPPPVNRGLGAKLRECRKSRDLSISALAKDVGVVSRSLEKLEGDKTEVDLEVLGKILARLKVAPGIEPEGLSLDSLDHQYFNCFSTLSRKAQLEVDDFMSFKLQQEKALKKTRDKLKATTRSGAKKTVKKK